MPAPAPSCPGALRAGVMALTGNSEKEGGKGGAQRTGGLGLTVEPAIQREIGRATKN